MRSKTMTPESPKSDETSAPARGLGSRVGFPIDSVQTTCLLVLTFLACGAALAWLRPAVVPFLVALALYYLLSPLSGWLVRRVGLSETLGVLGAAVIGLAVVGLIGVLVWACAAQVTREADTYAARIVSLSADPSFATVIEWVGLERDGRSGRLILISPDQSRRLVRFGVIWIQGLMTDAILVLLFLLFMLVGSPSAASSRAPAWTEEVASRVRRYLIEMFTFSFIVGVLVGATLGILGVKFWLSFGFLAFVLNFIPTIGPLIAALLPVPVVLLDTDLAVWAKVLALTLPPTIHGVIANVIQPRFQSRTQGVHPVATMLAMIIFGMLWGAVGAVLAVPLAAVLKIAFERIPGGRPFALLLAGQLDGGHLVVNSMSPREVPGAPSTADSAERSTAGQPNPHLARTAVESSRSDGKA
jgi:AI-2 transport protein TqsA